jgi:hypothetical protein
MHAPWFPHCVGNTHVPELVSHIGTRVPQRSQLWAAGSGAAHTCIVQAAAQRQLSPHSWTPLDPQRCVVPGSH